MPSIIQSLGISVTPLKPTGFTRSNADDQIERLSRNIMINTRLNSLHQSVKTDIRDLHRACRQGLSHEVSYLVDNNPSLIEAQSVSSEDGMGAGATALHYATVGNKPDIVEGLLNKGAALNAKTNRGLTPLHIACSKGYEECAFILIRAGASAIIKDGFGVSPREMLAQPCGDIALRASRSRILSRLRQVRPSFTGDISLIPIVDKVLYSSRK
jgi:ankyrin repeat protein